MKKIIIIIELMNGRMRRERIFTLALIGFSIMDLSKLMSMNF